MPTYTFYAYDSKGKDKVLFKFTPPDKWDGDTEVVKRWKKQLKAYPSRMRKKINLIEEHKKIPEIVAHQRVWAEVSKGSNGKVSKKEAVQILKSISVKEHADHDQTDHGNWARGISHEPGEIKRLKKKLATKSKSKLQGKDDEVYPFKPSYYGPNDDVLYAGINGTTIIGAHNGDTGLANRHARRWVKAVKDLDPETYRGLKVNFMHDEDFVFLGSMCYVDGKDEIWIFDEGIDYDDHMFQSAIIHELGHRQHLKLNVEIFERFELNGLGSTENFQRITTRWPEGTWKHYPEERHSGETFAEAFSRYHIEPDKLKEEMPEIYEFMESEYGKN